MEFILQHMNMWGINLSDIYEDSEESEGKSGQVESEKISAATPRRSVRHSSSSTPSTFGSAYSLSSISFQGSMSTDASGKNRGRARQQELIEKKSTQAIIEALVALLQDLPYNSTLRKELYGSLIRKIQNMHPDMTYVDISAALGVNYWTLYNENRNAILADNIRNATALGDIDREDMYDWTKFDQIKGYLDWQFTGERKLEKFVVKARAHSEAEWETFEIEPLYEIKYGRTGKEMDLEELQKKPKKRKARKESNNNNNDNQIFEKGKETKKIKKSESNSNNNNNSEPREQKQFYCIDSNTKNFGEEFIDNPYVVIAEELLVKICDISELHVNDLVAARYDLEDDADLSEWFVGRILAIGVIEKCKKLGREEYVKGILVKFKGTNEKTNGEWIELDDDVKKIISP